MTTDPDHPDSPDRSDGPPSSSDDEILEQLATRFLALWREQVAATADGADAASAIGRLYASLGADTTRMGEGFEAWGKLIGQMAMGQPVNAGTFNAGAANAGLGTMGADNPFAGAMGNANPLMAMMDQMAKAARDLPTQPFPGAMPFPPNMAAMAGMTGMKGMTGAGSDKGEAPSATPSATPPANGAGTDADSAGEAPSTKGAKKTRAAKNAAKGQGKNDQSTETKAASTKKTKQEAGGAKAASDAHGSRDDELAQLARRIADLSETIAALEAGTEATGGKPPERD